MSTGHGERQSRKAEQAIAALLTEPTIAAASSKIGVDESTLRKWLKGPRFMAAYRAARRRVVEVAIGRLQQATAQAVNTLEKNLTCGHAGSEIRAALAILEQSLRGVELMDLLGRVEELEAHLAEAGEDKS